MNPGFAPCERSGETEGFTGKRQFDMAERLAVTLVSRFKGALQARNGGLCASAASCKAPGCNSTYIRLGLGRTGAANHIFLPHPAEISPEPPPLRAG